ncbi:hypothetical protein ALI144C_31390 [Actinosynnema sp. ALI-1.44]|uniref:right-handed parallel beta-helix repeat-containing protein n=1 Tax=Actinosynnema sp. ALI-1.44 TaxID=1933779 RepID=UPI00097BFFBA|nr:right-handed parallel beta-helix repeat-containing protein [Actinosynnema sp. ALI-1.44]ONI77909.1 hypothetical protein ALI144C_31390 [Actinosynnema sp. ALI-1.44]
MALGAVAALMVSGPAVAAEAAKRIYFVDCATGDDAGSGLDPSRPWRTLGRVNSLLFRPGDVVAFRAGTTCVGTLAPRGSGTSARPITVTSYGWGSKARIDGQGASAAILLHNVQGWTLRDLDVTNTGPVPAAGQQRVGIAVLLEDYGVGHDYRITGVDVHDVNGCDCRYPVTSGGIVFYAGGSAVPTGLDGVEVRDTTVRHVDRVGIGIISTWQRRPTYPNGPGTGYAPMTRVRIDGNHLTDIGGEGITVFNGSGAVIQDNVVNGFNERSGDFNSGAYPWNSDSTIFRGNDVSNGKGTAMAFSVDGGDRGTVFEHNFSHANNGGFLLVCAERDATTENTVVRYNISQNDVGATQPLGVISMLCGDAPNTQIYGNTFYAPTSARLVNNFSPVTARLTDNVFVGMPAGSAINDLNGSYTNNLFHNVSTVPQRALYSVFGDPLFVAAGTATARHTAQGYQLRRGSPALSAGIPVPADGGTDFFGYPIPRRSPHIGAYTGPAR